MASIKKLFTLTAMSAALVACGGGGVDQSVAAQAAQVTINSASSATIASIVSALGSGATFSLPSAITFANAGAGAAASTGVAPVITLSPTTVPGAFAAFSMTVNGGTVTGTVSGGSCRFRVITGAGPFLAGETYVINPCTMAANTTGAPVGTTSNVNVTLNLAGTSAPSSGTVAVQVTNTGNNQASVVINGVTLTTTLPTGT